MEDDGDDKDDTKRRTRNLSEKKRRDQFNSLVSELSTMVSSNNRKMDKSTVLKSTISFLKNHNEVTIRSRAHDVQEDWKPAFLSNEEFTYLVLEALEGFVMVFSASGQIHYVSESITSLLGHNPGDVVNKTIFDLVSDEDRQNLYNLLQNPTSSDQSHMLVKGNEIRFKCNLRRRTLDFREESAYELIEFNGHFRTNKERAESDDGSNQHESKLLFVCTCRLFTPQLIRDVSLVDSDRNEFTSRHSLEWKFLFLDHRAPPIIGYLPFEVLGTSGYDYYHFDDLDKVVNCHEALMRKGELTSCYYRFLTKGQQWIWLQTRFYITYHQWNSKPEFVVCIHRVVSYADIAKSTKQETTENDEVPDVDSNQDAVKEQPPEEPLAPLSPNYLSDTGEVFANNYQPLSQTPSVKSASACSVAGTVATVATAGTSWLRSNFQYGGSDTNSLSGESRSSHQPTTTRSINLNPVAATCAHGREACEGAVMLFPQAKSRDATAVVPQHSIGAQYLEPSPYVAGEGLGVTLPGILPISLPLPLPPLPVIVSADQAQMQEQLHRKHEQLQQMIVRQQEELRQVKEQLLLARLGMLQPIIDVASPYGNPEGVAGQRLPGQLDYGGSSSRGYPPPPLAPPLVPPLAPPHAPPLPPPLAPPLAPPLPPPRVPSRAPPLEPPLAPPLAPPPAHDGPQCTHTAHAPH